ncbi:MAG TPA: hypothetical protein VIJ33_09805 [Solirubrobacteraceae bacterium]
MTYVINEPRIGTKDISCGDRRHLETQPAQNVRAAFLAAGCVFLLAAVLSAVVNTAASFHHGWWLVSYLSLVGGLSQMLLGVGQDVLAEHTHSQTPSNALLRTELGLWSVGTVAVAVGDLTAARTVLLLGSALLLIDLALFAVGLSRMRREAARRVVALERCYAALLLFLAISVLAGSSLGGALPG